jgi:hypothetical protein
MATKKYTGSCHCGAVQFEADIDLSKGSSRCNCTFDRKLRSWPTFVKPNEFKVTKGESNLQQYHGHDQAPHKFFCKTCGVYLYGSGDADYMGGPFVGVYITALNDATPEELRDTPVRYSDGLNNNWQNPPAITSYL